MEQILQEAVYRHLEDREVIRDIPHGFKNKLCSLVEQDLRALVDEMLDLSWQCVLAVQKGSSILGCVKRSVAIGLWEVILSLSALLSWDPTWGTASRLGTPSTRETWTH